MIDYSELMKVNEMIHNQLTTVSDLSIDKSEARASSQIQTRRATTNHQTILVEAIKIENEFTSDIGY